MKKNLKIVYVIIGTLIGAGFASGQEIYQFFYAYGIKGIIGIFIATVVLCYAIYKVLKIVKTKQINNYKQLLEQIVENRSKKKYLNIRNIINNVINLFVLITFFIMIAGFGAYFEEQLGVNHIIGSSILAIICFFVLQKNTQGVVKVNEIIIPVLIIFIILIGMMNLKTSIQNIQQVEIEKSGWLISSFLYAGYNSILLIPVLITLKEFLQKEKRNKQILKISLISGAITIILGSIIFIILSNVGEGINQIELPVAHVVSKMSKIIQIMYGIIILSSIFTTSVALGNSYINEVSKNRKTVSIIICIVAVLCSNIGFAKLITYAYPLFGILGLIQLVFLYKI